MSPTTEESNRKMRKMLQRGDLAAVRLYQLNSQSRFDRRLEKQLYQQKLKELGLVELQLDGEVPQAEFTMKGLILFNPSRFNWRSLRIFCIDYIGRGLYESLLKHLAEIDQPTSSDHNVDTARWETQYEDKTPRSEKRASFDEAEWELIVYLSSIGCDLTNENHIIEELYRLRPVFVSSLSTIPTTQSLSSNPLLRDRSRLYAFLNKVIGRKTR